MNSAKKQPSPTASYIKLATLTDTCYNEARQASLLTGSVFHDLNTHKSHDGCASAGC